MFRANASRYPGVDLAAQVASMHPAGRIGRVEDIVPVAAFLVREEAGWVNGQVIQVSGVSLDHYEAIDKISLFDLGVCRVVH